MADPAPPTGPAESTGPAEPTGSAGVPQADPALPRPAPAPEHWWLDPLAPVVGVVLLGVLIAVLHHPRSGMYVVCAAIAAGALLRLVLSPVHAGSLVVRRRRFDVAVLLSLSLGIGILAAVTPFPPG
jgi:Protein of unknown function (DUF3017)